MISIDLIGKKDRSRLSPERRMILTLREQCTLMMQELLPFFTYYKGASVIDNGKTIRVDRVGPKEEKAITLMLEAFEYVYFNTIHYCFSKCNLRRVNDSFYWFNKDYDSLNQETDQLSSIALMVNIAFDRTLERVMLEQEAYEGLIRYRKAKERINHLINIKTQC